MAISFSDRERVCACRAKNAWQTVQIDFEEEDRQSRAKRAQEQSSTAKIDEHYMDGNGVQNKAAFSPR
ncbi:hypothetical protein [Stappia indica]|uniref:Uncharacterized protein n=1 Tax=Stappia indica TaxID=538381 RepID=A0A857C6G6_9HYPH|nr:hypothetical protein [Stappia indica]QGZ34511.1 hypothetical protein GH266_08340 [Stappia indica]